jgi:hypothetical protein
MLSDRTLTRSVLAAVVFTVSTSTLAAAQQRAPAELYARQQRAAPVERTESAPPPPQVFVDQSQDARETRENLEELIKKLPPAVGRVLRTDSSLLSNDSYLAPYPALAAFLKQHPEIRNSPGFFFEHIGPMEFYSPSEPETRESQAIRIWRDLMEFLAVGGIFLLVTGALIWIIRTIVEQRRWHRASKVHTEVHNKLLDRFTANEDLLAYMETAAGRRFLESAPLSLDAPARPVGAPLSRILWSVQVGVVLAAGGLGLLFVSNRVIEEVAQPLFVIGVLALTVGAGFVVSAGASFLLSRRLGLFDPPAPPREHIESAGH